MKYRTLVISLALLSLVTVGGCGTKTAQQPAAASTSTQNGTPVKQDTIVPGDSAKYGGAANYQKYQDLAAKGQQDAQAQISAGMSAYANKDYQKAIDYYEKAIQINPQSGVAYNNIGNVYFRGLKDPKSALIYYQKATEVQPSYDFGWFNLALCQQALGDNVSAKATVTQGLSKISASDQLYKAMQQLETQIK